MNTTITRRHIEISQALVSGALIEPLVHPKPGGVTRITGHRDMNIYHFIRAASCLVKPLALICCNSCSDGIVASGIHEYIFCLEKEKLSRINVNTGTVLLLLILSTGAGYSSSIKEVVENASYYVKACSGSHDGEAYYKLLNIGVRKYMGRYEGPLPDIHSETREFPGLYKILSSTAWDIVHREVLFNYPLSRRIAEYIARSGLTEENLSILALELLAEYGDTLIARKHGWRAYYTALREARQVLLYYRRTRDRNVLQVLDRTWRKRGWNPGAVYDVLAAGISLYNLGVYYGEY